MSYREIRADESEIFDAFLARHWRNRPKRALDAQLRVDGTAEVASYLSIIPYRMRLGSVAVPVDGYGGVTTVAALRRRGFATVLIEETLRRSAERATMVVLNGIHNFYDRFGFVPAWSKEFFSVSTAALLAAGTEAPSTSLRVASPPWSTVDRQVAVDLYNRLHATRPATAVRDMVTYLGPATPTDWSGGEVGVVSVEDGRLSGYAIISLPAFGRQEPVEVRELVAFRREEALSLLVYAAEQAAGAGQPELIVHEAIDGVAGRILRQLGSRLQVRFDKSGGWMARVLHRAALVQSVRPELARRAGVDNEAPIQLLAQGKLLPRNDDLIRLLTGYWSLHDVQFTGAEMPNDWLPLLERWFPGGGSQVLERAFLHPADRY